MIIFLYTNDKCEYQAKYCIESFIKKTSKDDKVVYFTIGFESDIEYENLYKIKIPHKEYPTFHYYKAELSLMVMELFPKEEYFCFTDTDVLFSKKINFEKLKHNLEYPLASFGPHEYPFTYETLSTDTSYTLLPNTNLVKLNNGNIGLFGIDRVIYNEVFCMNYFNVPNRTMRYVWSCFYTFNRKCKEFFEEYTSMCKNEYLLKNRKWSYPFHDETSFNICLWKRNATQNLAFAFVNTHSYDVVVETETHLIKSMYIGSNIDSTGADWEYIDNSENVIFYHGFKDNETAQKTLKLLLNE